jgi:deazaflavin-dependent oxidoreductase (nitroreductase family)
MRKEDLSFLERAPVRHVFSAVVAAPRDAVFAAIADPTGWHAWFPGVRSARYASPPPYGVGTIREADVSGTRWVEEMIAWEPGRRWAYTVIEASTPLASAQVEVFDVEDVVTASGGAGGSVATRVRWTLAIEPRLLQRIAAPIAPIVMRRVFERAMRGLEAYLGGTPAVAVGGFDIDRWTTRLNPLVVRLLRSPLHRVLGGGLMLITVTGRRTGRVYTIPVGYQRDGDVLHVLVSKARRKQWWRNFRSAAPLQVELRGERFAAVGRVVDPRSEQFVRVVEATLRRLPLLARQLGVAWDARAGLSGAQREMLARETALVEIASLSRSVSRPSPPASCDARRAPPCRAAAARP